VGRTQVQVMVGAQGAGPCVPVQVMVCPLHEVESGQSVNVVIPVPVIVVFVWWGAVGHGMVGSMVEFHRLYMPCSASTVPAAMMIKRMARMFGVRYEEE